MIRVDVPCAALGDASPAARAGLHADLAFCHPDILGVLAVDDATIALAVRADGPDLRTQVERVAALSIRSYRFVRSVEPLWQHPALARYQPASALDRYLAAHTVTLGPGQYALVGAAAELRLYLDDRLRALAAAVGAEPWHLPSVEHTDDVIRSTGYLASHAQHVTFGYRLPCHHDQLARFTAAAKQRQLAWPDTDEHPLEPTGFILEPVVCHNVYRALRGARIDGRGRAITALGTCYRHEGCRFAPLVRQWEFSMREVVIVGTPDYVAEQREALVELTRDLALELDLDARLVIATDPFFVSEAASARTYQAVQSTKLELALVLDATSAVAAASFNLHGDHFTTPMAITNGHGERAVTACVGWGLERWMAAVIARHGGSPLP